GQISFVADSLIGQVAGANGSGELANVFFEGVSLGETFVDLSNVILIDSNLFQIPSSASGASTTIVFRKPDTGDGLTPIPEPTSITLMTVALFGLLVRRCRIFRQPDKLKG